MKEIRLVLCMIAVCFWEIVSSADRGDCEGLENPSGRNTILNNSLEVDPCAPVKFLRCLPQTTPSADVCSNASLDAKKFPIRILVSASTTSNVINVRMIAAIQLEFFLDAHSVRADGSYADDYSFAEKLGYFEDLAFEGCNSYACCSTNSPSTRNVARRCPTASATASPAFPNNTAFYTIKYSWHPPPSFQGYVVFVGSFFQSASTRWEKVISSVAPVVPIIPTPSVTLKPLVPIPSTTKRPVKSSDNKEDSPPEQNKAKGSDSKKKSGLLGIVKKLLTSLLPNL